MATDLQAPPPITGIIGPPLPDPDQAGQTRKMVAIFRLPEPLALGRPAADFDAFRPGTVPLALLHAGVRGELTAAVRAFLRDLFFVGCFSSPQPLTNLAPTRQWPGGVPGRQLSWLFE